MNHLRFQTNINHLTDIVRCCGDLTVEVHKKDGDLCNIEITSFSETEETAFIEIMNAICLAAEIIGATNIKILY